MKKSFKQVSSSYFVPRKIKTCARIIKPTLASIKSTLLIKTCCRCAGREEKRTESRKLSLKRWHEKSPNVKNPNKKVLNFGPWLWRSWQNGRFRHQRSAVRIPTSAMNYFECISDNCFPEKTKIKKKRLAIAQFF